MHYRRSLAAAVVLATGYANAAPQAPRIAAPAAQAAAPAAATAPDDGGFVQRGAHVHGKVVVNVALDGNTLAAELEAPAINVLGFERAPRDAAESRTREIVDRWLASGAGVLGVPRGAGCRLTRAEYTPPPGRATPSPRAASADATHDHDHDHDDGHADGHDDGEAEHADFRARYTFTCRAPAALDWVELWAAQRLRRVAEIEVNVMTPQRQTRQTLGADGGRIALR